MKFVFGVWGKFSIQIARNLTFPCTNFQVSYSASYEKVLVDFTRDYDHIKQVINKNKIDHCDKTSLNRLLLAANGIFSSNWGTQNYCQIIIVTDCGLGLGKTSIKNTINHIKNCRTGIITNETTVLPLPFQSKISVMCLGNIVTDASFKYGALLLINFRNFPNSDLIFLATNVYQQLLDISGQKGQLFIPKTTDSHEHKSKSESGNESSASANESSTAKAHLSERNVRKLFKQMAEINFKPFEATLNCGSYFKLESPVSLWPQPLVSFP